MNYRRLSMLGFVALASGWVVNTVLLAEPPHRWTPSIAPSAGRDMIYGPCLASSLGLGKDGPYVNRAFSVALSGDTTVCYDMDRYAPAVFWSGGFVDGSGTHLTSYKGSRPCSPKGKVLFQSLAGYGWAPDSTDEAAESGLPIPWADYLGHYVHGDRVVLSYNVNGRGVLESPSSVSSGDRAALIRTFNVESGKTPLTLVPPKHDLKPDVLHHIAYGGKTNGSLLFFVLGEDRKSIAWGTDGDTALSISIPPSQKPLSFSLLMIRQDDPSKSFDIGNLIENAHTSVSLAPMTHGGPSRWPQTIETRGVVSNNDKSPYVMDTLSVPHDNPWKSWMQLSALDFFSNGRMAVSTLNGDVWLVSGIDEKLDHLQWKRFAAGLYEPLGLKIVDDVIYVTCRDRITRLHDLNGDDEADFYENFYAGGTPGYGYHAFAFELQTDSQGNFYFVKGGRKAWGGGDDYNHLIRVSPDGKHAEMVAGGFRHPNGMGIGPHDEILVADNEGDSIITSRVNLIRPGGFYGYASDNYKKDEVDPPLFWLPKEVDSSCGGQTWAKDYRWGPLAGTIFHTSYSKLCAFYAMMQKTDEGANAAVVKLPFRFNSGLMRPRVNPRDGQVYVCGLKGWDTAAVEDGCLNRIRYTGQPAHLVRSFEVTAEGLRLGFTCPLDREEAADPDNYSVEQWNYKSKNPTPEEVFVDDVEVATDGRGVLIQLEELTPVDQMEIGMSLRAADGAEIRETVYATVNVVPKRQ